MSSLAVGLAFLFGFALTMRPVMAAGVGFKQAVRVALAADTLSILVMEVRQRDHPRSARGDGRRAQVGAVLGAPAFALVVAFVVTVPVNRAMISRGKGHAVAHEFHRH